MVAVLLLISSSLIADDANKNDAFKFLSKYGLFPIDKLRAAAVSIHLAYSNKTKVCTQHLTSRSRTKAKYKNSCNKLRVDSV